MTEHSIRQLGAAVILQAVKDYFGNKATPEKRAEILKDLRSAWVRNLTGGTSANVAEQLEKHPDEIKARLRRGAKREAV